MPTPILLKTIDDIQGSLLMGRRSSFVVFRAGDRTPCIYIRRWAYVGDFDC